MRNFKYLTTNNETFDETDAKKAQAELGKSV